MSKGFFSGDPESNSMGRLLSFMVTLSGIIIFSIASFSAIAKGADLGTNIVNGCVWIIGVGVVGKAGASAAERIGKK